MAFLHLFASLTFVTVFNGCQDGYGYETEAGDGVKKQLFATNYTGSDSAETVVGHDVSRDMNVEVDKESTTAIMSPVTENGQMERKVDTSKTPCLALVPYVPMDLGSSPLRPSKTGCEEVVTYALQDVSTSLLPCPSLHLVQVLVQSRRCFQSLKCSNWGAMPRESWRWRARLRRRRAMN